MNEARTAKIRVLKPLAPNIFKLYLRFYQIRQGNVHFYRRNLHFFCCFRAFFLHLKVLSLIGYSGLSFHFLLQNPEEIINLFKYLFLITLAQANVVSQTSNSFFSDPFKTRTSSYFWTKEWRECPRREPRFSGPAVASSTDCAIVAFFRISTFLNIKRMKYYGASYL